MAFVPSPLATEWEWKEWVPEPRKRTIDERMPFEKVQLHLDQIEGHDHDDTGYVSHRGDRQIVLGTGGGSYCLLATLSSTQGKREKPKSNAQFS